jgi:hypothetical protein
MGLHIALMHGDVCITMYIPAGSKAKAAIPTKTAIATP